MAADHPITSVAVTPTMRDLARLVRGLKGLLPGSSPLRLPLRDADGRSFGVLEAVGPPQAANATVVDLLTRWRREHMDNFMTRFEATAARTAVWLRDVVLGQDGRALFLIRDDRGALVGQFGLCGIEPGRVELDNAIRGEGGAPGLMVCTELHMLALAFEWLRAEVAIARVFSHNLAARLLHKEVGLHLVRAQYLGVMRVGHEVRYEPTEKPVRETAGLRLLTLAIKRERFENLHGWLRLGPARGAGGPTGG